MAPKKWSDGGYITLPQAIGKYNELQVVPVVILFLYQSLKRRTSW